MFWYEVINNTTCVIWDFATLLESNIICLYNYLDYSNFWSSPLLWLYRSLAISHTGCFLIVYRS